MMPSTCEDRVEEILSAMPCHALELSQLRFLHLLGIFFLGRGKLGEDLLTLRRPEIVQRKLLGEDRSLRRDLFGERGFGERHLLALG
jgi:hypothetical protein